MKVCKKDFQAMGTEISLEIQLGNEKDSNRAEEALQKAERLFKKNEQIFSRFQKDSELSYVNKHLGKVVPISIDMLSVLELCLEYYDKSLGYFDPRIVCNLEEIGYDKDFRTNSLDQEHFCQMSLKKTHGKLRDDLVLDRKNKTALLHARIDTTGLVKGYTVDQATALLVKEGFVGFTVDAGGDMYSQSTLGQPTAIEVEGVGHDKLLLKIKDEGIATSGITRKRWTVGDKTFHHLINPTNPTKFPVDLSSVTVIAKNAVEADVYAKVLFLMGENKGKEFAEGNSIKGLFLGINNDILLTTAMKENLWTN